MADERIEQDNPTLILIELLAGLAARASSDHYNGLQARLLRYSGAEVPQHLSGYLPTEQPRNEPV